MSTIEYRESGVLPCHVPKMKRAALEDFAIRQMFTIQDLEGKVAEARGVAERACRQHNALLAQGRRVTCVYCGHQYSKGTAESQTAELTVHVEQCHLHPLYKARAHIAELVSASLIEQSATRDAQAEAARWKGRAEVAESNLASSALYAKDLVHVSLERDALNTEAARWKDIAEKAQQQIDAIDAANRGADPCMWERMKDELVRCRLEVERLKGRTIRIPDGFTGSEAETFKTMCRAAGWETSDG